MNDKPLVSILLPVKNAEKYLSDCVQSLLDQTYEHIEIIAIDDCSSDNSHHVLQRFRKLDKRIKVYRNVKRYGLRLTLNRCVKRSNGSFLAFMNQKDIATKSKIQRQLNFLLQNPKIAAVGTQCYYIDEVGKKLEQSDFPNDHAEIYNTLANGNSLQPESILINKTNVPKDLVYFNKDKYPYIYRRLLLQIVKYGQVANISAKLYLHRSPRPKLSIFSSFMPSMLTFALKARTLHDYRPPIRFFFLPLLRGL